MATNVSKKRITGISFINSVFIAGKSRLFIIETDNIKVVRNDDASFSIGNTCIPMGNVRSFDHE
jgi:hypothetical protein